MPKVVLNIRKKDMWLIEELKRNVKVKERMGMKSSLGFEVAKELHRALNPERVEELEEKAKKFGLGKEGVKK